LSDDQIRFLQPIGQSVAQLLHVINLDDTLRERAVGLFEDAGEAEATFLGIETPCRDINSAR
jgi:hypothetical protein